MGDASTVLTMCGQTNNVINIGERTGDMLRRETQMSQGGFSQIFTTADNARSDRQCRGECAQEMFVARKIGMIHPVRPVNHSRRNLAMHSQTGNVVVG